MGRIREERIGDDRKGYEDRNGWEINFDTKIFLLNNLKSPNLIII